MGGRRPHSGGATVPACWLFTAVAMLAVTLFLYMVSEGPEDGVSEDPSSGGRGWSAYVMPHPCQTHSISIMHLSVGSG